MVGGVAMPFPYSKEELRKMYGIVESTDPPDPTVVARRGIHEAALKWVNKYPPRLNFPCVLFGFFVLLLPVFFKPWRAVIQSIPILGAMFESFSRFRGGMALALFNFFALMIVLRYLWGRKQKTILGNKILISRQEALEMELYPTTRKQEVGYWIDLFSWCFEPLVYLMIFGTLALIFMRRLA